MPVSPFVATGRATWRSGRRKTLRRDTAGPEKARLGPMAVIGGRTTAGDKPVEYFLCYLASFASLCELEMGWKEVASD